MATILKIGDEIPALTKNAYAPIEEDARNPIHKDDYAREHGMRGALVPGSTLLSYVLEMLYNHFGEKWLCRGRINVSFIGGGAVNGDVLTAHGSVKAIEAEDSGGRITLDVWMANQNGEKVVVGEASCIA
ncbi:MAG: MaoC family dehydratase [Deltaproteobacteria bacterium]|nr:MaoC family dehydratase [Deltaproteobacteria bacterium]